MHVFELHTSPEFDIHLTICLGQIFQYLIARNGYQSDLCLLHYWTSGDYTQLRYPEDYSAYPILAKTIIHFVISIFRQDFYIIRFLHLFQIIRLFLIQNHW